MKNVQLLKRFMNQNLERSSFFSTLKQATTTNEETTRTHTFLKKSMSPTEKN